MLSLLLGGGVADTASAIFSMLLSAVGVAFGLDYLGAFYAAYKRACMRLEDEKWLLEKCREPVFYSKMRAHTQVCSEVETNARIGAVWAALREVTDGARITWQPYLVGCAFATIIVLPVFFLCAARLSHRCAVVRRRKAWAECIPFHSDFGPARSHKD